MVGSAGAVITYFFGGWNDLLSLFLFVIVIDYVSGIFASIIEGKGLSSEVGFKGLLKKFAMIAVIALAHRADVALDMDMLMYGAVFFYLANELLSITENYGRMGLPMPDKVKSLIQVLRDRG